MRNNNYITICDKEECKYYRKISYRKDMNAESWHNRKISSLCMFCQHRKKFDFFTKPNRAFGMISRRIVDLYKKDPTLTRRQMAERLGTNSKYISKVLIDNNLIRPRESKGGIKRKILSMARNHPDYSSARIAREVETSISYVKKILSE